ncbi:MAG: SpoIIE family protein phosphatase [Terracidiphilus sp.]
MACRSFPILPLRVCAVAALALLALCLVPRCLSAQTFDATTLHQPTDLSMTWLLKAGDDPAYARTDFDDSRWMRFDPSQSLTGIFQARPQVVWYRLHVKVAPNETGLALAEWNLSSAFEIYVNGKELFETGKVAPFVPYTFDGHLIQRIPEADIATGSIVIAMRVHISGLDWVTGFPGYYAYNLTIGQERALSDSIWLTLIGRNALFLFFLVTGLGLGIVALALFFSQPHQREYVWIFLLFLASGLQLPLTAYRFFHNLPSGWEYVQQSLGIAVLIFETLMYFALLRIRFGWWMRAVLGITVAAQVVSMVGTANALGSSLTTFLTVIPQAALFAAIIPILLIVNWRRGNREAGILLIPAIFIGLNLSLNLVFYVGLQIPALAQGALRWQTAIENPTLGPFTLTINDLFGCFFVLSLGVILVLRSTRISRQQALIESEMAAAREVQQVILPEQMETVPGFTVESIYEPAQQVGGDFFQVLPDGAGGLLLVIGDVTGKGLPAAMLVSVLVGAIRAATDYTSDPAELLANLNQRLVGRVEGGFSTALVARIGARGQVSIANAGHLPPYIDGGEVELPGALPLGVESGTHYQTVSFELPPGSRLTFYSDGIVEAQNARGELFGFERSSEMSLQPVAAIVKAAKEFGQQDDMTVVAITRDAAVATAA